MGQLRNSSQGYKCSIIKFTLTYISNDMERSTLGFNVIKKMLQDNQQRSALVNILTEPVGNSSKVQAIFKLMQQKNQVEPIYTKKEDESTSQYKYHSEL